MKKFISLYDEVYVDYALLKCTPANYAVTRVKDNRYVSLSYLLMDKIDFDDYCLEVKNNLFASENHYKLHIFAQECSEQAIKRICNMFSEQPEVSYSAGLNDNCGSLQPSLVITFKFQMLYAYENE